MPRCRIALVILCVVFTSVPLQAQKERKTEVSEKQFRHLCLALLDDPLSDSAAENVKLIILFVIDSPKVAVFYGAEEMKWIGDDKVRSNVLLAAYSAGNAQAQLLSGVKRNDRYSGLLSLFHVYRALRAQDKDFRIPEVEDLLELHKKDQLVKHLQLLEEKKPTKLTAEQEEAIRKLRGREK
jgi:hypothetical protein